MLINFIKLNVSVLNPWNGYLQISGTQVFGMHFAAELLTPQIRVRKWGK